MDNTNGLPADPPPAISEVLLHDLDRAERLLAGLANLQLRRDLCDVLVLTETEAEDEAVNAKEMASDEAEDEVVSKEDDEVVDEATAEEMNEATNEAPGETNSEETSGVANETKVKRRGIWAHRAVLAAGTEVFNQMLLNNSAERNRLIVPGLTSEELWAVVKYIYAPDSVILTEENAPALVLAAIKMELDGMRTMVCKYLADELSVHTAVSTLACARLHNCPELVPTTLKFIEDNAEFILDGEQILSVKVEELKELVEMERLAAREECIFNAVLRWTMHRLETRREHLYDLLQLVRLPLVPPEVLKDSIRTAPLAKADSRALQLVIDVLNQPEHPDRRIQAAARAKYRSGAVPPEPYVQHIWLLIGGKTEEENCTDTVLKCTLPECNWEPVASLPEPVNSAGVAVLGSSVYVIGGDDGKLAKDTVFVYDAGSDSWWPGPPLPRAACWLAAAALGRRVFAAGGVEGRARRSLPAALALDPREGQWRHVAAMRGPRHALGLAALDGSLYAVGGLKGSRALNSTERYDPVADSWTKVQDMAEPRACVGVSVMGDTLYAVGGFKKRDDLHRSVERFHPDSGWETVNPSMPLTRRAAAVVSHHGQLYVAGGFYNQSEFTKKVMMLDPTTEEWSELLDLPKKRTGAASVVVSWSRRAP